MTINDFLGLKILGAVLFGVAIANAVRMLVKPPTALATRVRPYTAASRSQLGHNPDAVLFLKDGLPTSAGSVLQRLYRPLAESLVRLLNRLFGGAFNDDQLALRLRQADILTEVAEANRVFEYRIGQVTSGLTFGFALGAAAQVVRNQPSFSIALFIIGLVIGVSRKSAALSKGIDRRRQRMRVELYTINQLLAIYLRTSGSPVLAAQRLARRGQGATIDELSEALRLHARGMSASKAFTRIAEQTPEPFAARTYKLLATGSEQGADLATALLSLSEDVRDNRRTEVRRNATKRQGAMLLPIIAILAPVMLIFIAAPIPDIVLGNR